jgi:hypothetical protein
MKELHCPGRGTEVVKSLVLFEPEGEFDLGSSEYMSLSPRTGGGLYGSAVVPEHAE